MAIRSRSVLPTRMTKSPPVFSSHARVKLPETPLPSSSITSTVACASALRSSVPRAITAWSPRFSCTTGSPRSAAKRIGASSVTMATLPLFFWDAAPFFSRSMPA